MTEGETEGEREMKTKLKADKEHLSVTVLFPSEYFVNKLNPVLDYKLLDVMWICFEVCARAGSCKHKIKILDESGVCLSVSLTFIQTQRAAFSLMQCVVSLFIIPCVTMPGSFWTEQ